MKRVFGSIVERVGTTLDGSLKITLALQEIPSGVGGELIDIRGKYVKVLITDDNISSLEQDAVAASQMTGITNKKNSPSQRLRGVIFRRWENDNKGHAKFETYYEYEMEAIISKEKEYLI